MNDEVKLLSCDLERKLLNKHGPLLGGSDLATALGYPSLAAFRQSIQRDQVPIRVFSIDKRKGKFALVQDVALWLACQKLGETFNE